MLFLDEDSSDEEEPTPMLALLVVPVSRSRFVASIGFLPPLFSSLLFSSLYSVVVPSFGALEASASLVFSDIPSFSTRIV